MPETVIILLAFLALLLVAIVVSKFRWVSILILWLLPIVKAFTATRITVFQVVDLTLLALLLICAIVAWKPKHLGRLKKVFLLRPFIVCHLVLALVMGLTLAWTTAPNYGQEKTLKYATFSLLTFLAPILIIDSKKDLIRLLYGMIFASIIVSLAIIFLPSYQMAYGGQVSYRDSAFESNPLNPAFLIAVSASFCFLIPGRGRIISTPVMTGVFLLFQYAVFRSGCRSMFVQSLLAIGVWSLITKANMRWFYRVLIVALMVGIPMYVLAADSRLGSRVTRTLSEPVEALSGSGRLYMWQYCLKKWPERPIGGYGVGSFATNFGGGDRRFFPHNMFIEAIYEIGIVGLVFLLAQFVLTGLAFLRFKNKSHYTNDDKELVVTLFATLVAATLSISLHWDISDNRLLWNIIGVLFTAIYLCKSEKLNKVRVGKPVRAH